MNMNDEKNLFNMPGDELNDWLSTLSRYILVVETVAVIACLPILTRQHFIFLTAATVLLFIDSLFMKLSGERKSKKWHIIRNIQFLIAAINVVALALSFFLNAEIFVRAMSYITVVLAWIHSGICFFEYRKDERIPLMRYAGAFTIAVTIIVFMLVKNWLDAHGISFG